MNMRFLSLAVALSAGAAIWFSSSDSTIAQEEKAWGGQKWEYRVLRIEDRRTGNTSGQRSRGSASEEKLNELGEQGWELVSVRNDGSSQPVFYFKRPK